MKTTGTLQTDAMLIPSCQSPRLVAPSPQKQRTTRSLPPIFLARLTPTAAHRFRSGNVSLAIELPLDPELVFAPELHVIQHVEKGLLSRKSDRRSVISRERLRVRRSHLHWDLQNRRYSKDVSFFNSAS